MKIQVRIKPNSKKPGIEKAEDGTWIVSVKEPAIEGKANEALLKAVALEFGLAPSRINLLRGHKSKWKILEIDETG